MHPLSDKAFYGTTLKVDDDFYIFYWMNLIYHCYQRRETSPSKDKLQIANDLLNKKPCLEWFQANSRDIFPTSISSWWLGYPCHTLIQNAFLSTWLHCAQNRSDHEEHTFSETKHRTWKWMVGIRSFPLGMAYVQRQAVSSRECNLNYPSNSKKPRKTVVIILPTQTRHFLSGKIP